MRAGVYDISRSYDWNYENVPAVPDVDVPLWNGDWTFCGLPGRSPLGIPAGPLLNSRWIRYYAALGFDVLTYKTVRSVERASYDVPNLLPVKSGPLAAHGGVVLATPGASDFDSWAISFGMPSKAPDVWRDDVGKARAGLGNGQLLVVSVVASPQAGWTMDQVAADFTQCAVWASAAGAHAIEANLSCPNVCTRETDLYLSPEASRQIAEAIRERVTDLPLILKIGMFDRREQAEGFVDAVNGFATAINSANSITAFVRGAEGRMEFAGARRGIGGAVITRRCLEELRMLADVVRTANSSLRLIAVGGVRTAEDVRARLDAGAHHVQLATAAMIDPLAGVRIAAGWPALPDQSNTTVLFA